MTRPSLRATVRLALPLLLVFLGRPLSADHVTLRDGSRFDGRILRANEREVTLECGSGAVLSFRMSQVAALHRVTPEGSARGADPDASRTTPGTRLQRLGPLRAELGPSFEPRPLPASSPGGAPAARQPDTAQTRLAVVESIWEEPITGARLTVTVESFPATNPSFAEVTQGLQDDRVWKLAQRLLRWAPGELDGAPCVIAEFLHEAAEHPRMLLVAWVEFTPGRLACVQLEVSETAFRAAPDLYRQPFRTLTLPGPPTPPSSP